MMSNLIDSWKVIVRTIRYHFRVKIPPGTDPLLEDLIKRLLDKNPETRLTA